MKKQLFLLLCLIATAWSTTAWADEYIRVSNKKMPVSESWKKPSYYFNNTYYTSVEDGYVSWDASKRILTLSNLYLNRENPTWGVFDRCDGLDCLIVHTTSDVTINILGGNSLSTNCNGQTMALYSNTTFTGDGSLRINNKFWEDGGWKKPSIDLMEENLTVTVDGPRISLNYGIGIRGKNNTGKLRMKSGKLSGDYYTKQLLKDMGNVIFDFGMGAKEPHGIQFSTITHSLAYIGTNVEVVDKEVSLSAIKYYGFRICGKEVTENNYDRINHYFGVTEGSVWFSPQTNRLILDNATIKSQNTHPTIRNHSNDGLIIQLIGENMFEYYGSEERKALDLSLNTTVMSFEEDARLKATSALAGIYVGSGVELTLQNVQMDVPCLAGGNKSSKLNIGNNVKLITIGHEKGSLRTLTVVNKSSKPGVAVISNNGTFLWNRTDNSPSGLYRDKNTLEKNWAKLSTEEYVEWYPVYVGGHQVNSGNCDRINNECIEGGTLSYDRYKKRLLMDGVTINNNNLGADAIRGSEKLDILLKGNNAIRGTTSSAISCTKDIVLDKGDGVSGDVSLTITGNKAKISSSQGVKVANAVVSVEGLDANTLTVKDSKLSVTKELDINRYIGEDEVVASTPEAPAYYDSEKQTVVATKGGVNFVPSSGVTTYPIAFCGEKVNSANASCVMNKYVKIGTLSVIEKGNNDYDIILKKFGIVYDSSVPVFEPLSGANMCLYINSTNIFSFQNAGRDALFIKGRDGGTIDIVGTTEVSKLLVYGSSTTNAGAIFIPNGLLRFNKRNDCQFEVVVPRIFGSGSSPRFFVHEPYLYVTGNQQGTVANIKCYTESGAELYNTSWTPREIRDDGIYSNGKICTEEVKFVKKGESYIPVERILLDKQTLAFTKKRETTQLTATVLPADATNRNVRWESWDESVATVDADGNVTAVGNGETQIYAFPAESDKPITYYDRPSTVPLNRCNVTVDIPEPTDIALDQTEVLIDRESIGGVYLTASLTPSNADTEFTWESSDENIVSVLPNSGKKALVHRVADEGEATVTVKTSNGKQATCKITIHYPITPMFVDFEQRIYTLTEAGEQIKLVPIVTPDNCEKLSFTWYTSSDAISLSDDGTVTARRNGSAVVECWACYDGQKYAPGEVRIYVEIPPTPVIATGLELKASESYFYALGETALLTPIFTPENVTNKELTWNSENPDVATVDEDGFVTIVGWGDCRITATTTDGSNIKAGYTFTAIDPSTIPDPVYATGIKLDENEVTLMRGEETRIALTIDPANYNGDIMLEPMEGDISLAQVNMEWDWNTNRSCIYVRTEEWSEMSGDLKIRVRPNMVDWEKLNAMGIWVEPADTLTIHVLAPIIFTAASPEDIDITYHVTDLNEKTCEVYAQTRPGTTIIDPMDVDIIPAVSQTATGKLTVPAKANGYWVTNVMACAFNRCSSMTEIEFSEGIETIGDYACYCALYGLERVTLPSTIKELGQYCFSLNFTDYTSYPDGTYHNNIHEVNIKASTPPTGQNGSDISWSGAFEYLATDAVLYVPTGALDAYNVEPWTRWFSRIAEKQFFEDPDGIIDIKTDELKAQNVGATYDLSGRKLNGKPTKSGLYIVNGKKVVIK